MKKLLSLIITICMVACPALIPVSAISAKPILKFVSDVSLSCGQNVVSPSEVYPTGKSGYSTKAGTSGTSIEQVIYNGLINFPEGIDVSYYNIPYTAAGQSTLTGYYERVTNCYPELYMASLNKFYVGNDGSIFTDIFPIYAFTESEYVASLRVFNDRINRIISGIPGDASTFEKIFYVYNYITHNFHYEVFQTSLDFTIYGEPYSAVYSYQDAYHFFTENSGVCQGYTLAFTSVMTALGIDCTSAMAPPVPKYDEKGNELAGHTWNVITFNGNSYHIDNTWDSPLKNSSSPAIYQNFLKTDTNFSNSEHDPWYILGRGSDTLVCDDATYESSNYLWNKTATPLVEYGGSWYFINDTDISSTALRKTENFINYTTTALTGLRRSDITRYSSGLVLMGDELIYNSDKQIKAFNLKTNTNRVVATPSTSWGDIFRIYFNGNGIGKKHIVSDTPNTDLELVVIRIKRDTVFTKPEAGTSTLKLSVLGDITGDDEVTADDIVTLRRYIIDGTGSFNTGFADLSGNIGVDIKDFIRLKKIALGVA